MHNYLDTKKSIIISAPAGSGKTEKLARRYISLIEDCTELEKILAITFTEKAAAEMKDRILNIMQKEKDDIFRRIKEKIPLMRITTIHAFCRKLITRFAMELGLDPSLEVLDEFRSSQLWSEAVYDALRDEKDKLSVFFDYLKLKGLKGWNTLFRTLDSINKKRPFSEFLLDTCDENWNQEEKTLIDLYNRCLSKYKNKKNKLHSIDFNDMEILAYRAITSNPEWLNILYAFDEHTDHILIDEFQDTSYMQWKIIDKITEEWRSGIGAKRAGGKTPTVFLVGDEKQSIYMFRGANVSVFHEVKNRLKEWLGEEAEYIEVKENYRSISRIINFANSLFSHLMQGSLTESWRTKYSPFSPTRTGNGSIKLLLISSENNSKLTRIKEAMLLSKQIASIVGDTEILEDSVKRKCRFSDIAVLIRNRTHLSSFENAFRENNIPYIVAGGIGFYDEPEVALLKELVSFFTDPHDDFSLFVLLRSPLFGFSESMLISMLSNRDFSLFESLNKSKTARFSKACGLLEKHLLRSHNTQAAIIIEEFLNETHGWKIFHEIQRHANIKKFLRILESYESEGLSLIEIREKLIQSTDSNEAKANVNTENLDVVKIMTIHGAKGLQFPIVFLPSLDDSVQSKGGSVFIDEVDNKIKFAYEEESENRKKNYLFILRREKEFEEEKRLFYVAVTRSMDHLFMSGAVKKGKNGENIIKGRLSFIEGAFPGSISNTSKYSDIFDVMHEKDLAPAQKQSHTIVTCDSTKHKEPVYTEKVSISAEIPKWLSVTDVTEDIEIKLKHGEDWRVLGIIFHRLFEEISNGIIDYKRLNNRAEILISQETSLRRQTKKYMEIILNDFKKLDNSGFLQKIILPTGRSYSELPFVLQKKNSIYKGRIDRIIIRDNTAFIYDYKTFPINDSEIEELTEKYRFQMNVYSEACGKLFSLKTKSFILFTHKPAVVEI